MKKFKNFLLENISEDFKFSTNDIKADLYGIREWDKVKHFIEENDNYDDSSVFHITWKINFDLREYGIKSSDIEILDFSGNILINKWEDDKDIEEEFEFINEIENFEIEIENDNFSHISIQDVEINFSTKKITITF